MSAADKNVTDFLSLVWMDPKGKFCSSGLD